MLDRVTQLWTLPLWPFMCYEHPAALASRRQRIICLTRQGSCFAVVVCRSSRRSDTRLPSNSCRASFSDAAPKPDDLPDTIDRHYELVELHMTGQFISDISQGSPSRGSQITLGIAQKVRSIIWEYHTKQSCKVQGVIVSNNTFTTGGAKEPKTRPLDVSLRAVAQGRTNDSLGRSAGMLIFLRHITQEAAC